MRDSLPTSTHCATCLAELAEPYAFCGNCRDSYCLSCGSRHYCTSICQANGCLAGLCVRVVANGELSRRWGIPPELLEPASPQP